MLRLALSACPESETMRGSLPWGVAMTPLGTEHPPVATGPNMARCQSCFGYISPYSPMHRHELEWICCLCGTVNELEARYGLSHPEVTQPMVECILPFDRFGKLGVPDAPAFLALVDLTGSVAYIDAVKVSLRCLVKSLPEYCLFGFMTFDETLGVYSLSARSPQVRVTPLPRAATRHPKGILDLFSLPQIFCQLGGEERTTALAAIDLLTATGGADARPAADYSLPAGAASQRPSQPSVVGRGLGPALQMLLASLGEMYKEADELCLRTLVFLAGMPNYGEGALSVPACMAFETATSGGGGGGGGATAVLSEAPSTSTVVGIDKAVLTEKQASELLKPSSTFYRGLALQAFELKVCLDLWVLSDAHVDLASLRFLATTTSGQIHRYPQAAFARVPAEMQTFAQRPHAFHCLARLRVSHELATDALYGSAQQDKIYPEVFHMAACDPELTILMDLRFSNNSGYSQGFFTTKHATKPCLQLAFSYTIYDTTERALVRKLRVQTVDMPLAATRAELLESLVPETALLSLVHKTNSVIMEERLKEAWVRVMDWLVALLTQYCEDQKLISAPDARFSYYPNLQSLQRFLYGYLTGDVINNAFLVPDQRTHLIHLYGRLPGWRLRRRVYPWLVVYRSLDSAVSQAMPLSVRTFSADAAAIYLLDTDEQCLLYAPGNAAATMEAMQQMKPPCRLFKDIQEIASRKQMRAVQVEETATFERLRQLMVEDSNGNHGLSFYSTMLSNGEEDYSAWVEVLQQKLQELLPTA